MLPGVASPRLRRHTGRAVGVSLDLAVVGVEFQSTGGEAVTRTFSDVTTASDRLAASTIRANQGLAEATAATQRIASVQTEQMAVTANSIESYRLAAISLDKMGLSAADATVAMQRMGLANVEAAVAARATVAATSAASIATAESASMFQAAGTGAGRLNQSLRTLELQMIGMQGAAGRSAATFGAFQLGSGPLLALGLVIVGVTKAYEFFTAAATAHAEAEKTVADAMDKSAAAYRAQLDPIGAITAQIAVLILKRRELVADTAAPSVNWWQTILGDLFAPAQTLFMVEQFKQDQKDIIANTGRQAEAQRLLIGAYATQFKAESDAFAAKIAAEKSAAEEHLRDVQTVADANAALNIAQLKAIGDIRGANQAIYDLAVQKDATEAHVAEIAGKLSDVEIAAVQTAKDKLALLVLHTAEMQRQLDLIKLVPTVTVAPAGESADMKLLFDVFKMRSDAMSGLRFEPMAIDVPAVQKSSDQTRELYRSLTNDMRSLFSSTFTDIAKTGLAAFDTMAADIEKLLVRTAADLIAKNLFKDLASQSNQPAPPVGVGSPFGGSVPLPTAALVVNPIALAAMAIPGLIGGIVDGFDAAAKKLQAAQEAYQTALNSFNTSLGDFVAGIGVIAGSMQAQVIANKKTLDQLQQPAFAAAAGSPAFAGGMIAATGAAPSQAQLSQIYAAGGIPALQQLQGFLDYVASHGGDVGAVNAAFTTLYKNLGLTADALVKLEATQIAAWVKSVDDAYTASLPVIGSALTSINGITAAYQTGVSYANSLADATVRQNAIATLTATETNNLTAAFAGMSVATLDALISSGKLTGGVLALASAADTAARAVLDAASTARNATAQGGLYGRLATATAGSDPTMAAWYAAAAKAQVNSDAVAAATKVMTDDIAAGASAAVIANDKYTISLTKTTIAAEAAAAAQAVAASLALRNLKATADISGNAQDMAAYQAAVRLAAEQQEVAAAVAAGYTKVQLASLKATQANEDFAASMVALRTSLAAAAAATDALRVRELNVTGQTGAGSALALLDQQRAEYAAAVAAGDSSTYLAYLKKVQGEETKAAQAANLLAQQQAFAAAQTSNASAAGVPTSTAAPASATSVNLAVGVSDTSVARMTGMLQSGLIYQAVTATSTKRMTELQETVISLLRDIRDGKVTLDDIDRGLAALGSVADTIAGIPPGNR